MSWAARQNHIDKALLRAAQKMMQMAHAIECLGDPQKDGWEVPATQMRAEAVLAFEAPHKVFD